MGDHIIIISTIVTIETAIITAILLYINARIKGMDVKHTNLCSQLSALTMRLKEEKEDREKSAKEKHEDIKDLFTQIRALVSNQSRLEERIVSIKENCDRNCHWDGRERRHLTVEEE